MTTPENLELPDVSCPAHDVLKLLVGKWKPEILRLACQKENIRFNSILRQLPGASKQSVSVALRELEKAELLSKSTITQKPLHIEYSLTEKGKSIVPIFALASVIAKEMNSADPVRRSADPIETQMPQCHK